MLVRLRILLALVSMLVGVPLLAQTPPAPTGLSGTALDKLAVDALKDVHNRGAYLNNNGNPEACYYLYEGGLRLVQPFLAHRPTVQKVIESGLEEVSKTEGIRIKAFRLHEIIEQVRSELKKEIQKAVEATPAPMPKPKEPVPMPKPKEPVPMPKPKEPAPMPKPKVPPAAKDGELQGKVMLDGKPFAGATVTVVSTSRAVPRIYDAKVQADGSYAFKLKPLPPGEYAVMITHETAKVPELYQTTLTSGLRVSVKAGTNNLDLNLKSK